MRRAVQNDAAEGLKEYLKVHCSGRDFCSHLIMSARGCSATAKCVKKAEYFYPENQSLVVEK